MKDLRVGIIGAQTDFGLRVRELLEQRVVLTDLKLFSSGDNTTSTLTQFGDEVVVTQPLDLDMLSRLDVVFVSAGDSDETNEASHRAAEEGIVTLVSRAVGLEAALGEAGSDGEQGVGDDQLLYIVPRTSSWLVGTTLQALRQLVPVKNSVATVAVPASEWGAAASEEFHQQIVQLLGFQPFPAEVLEEQVAFNIGLAAKPSLRQGWTHSLEWEAQRLAGGDGRVRITALQAPMFHGYAASVWVDVDEPPTEAAIHKHFNSYERFKLPVKRRGRTTVATPATAAESDKLHVGNIRVEADGIGMWLVSNSLAYDPALRAVELALDRLSRVPGFEDSLA